MSAELDGRFDGRMADDRLGIGKLLEDGLQRRVIVIGLQIFQPVDPCLNGFGPVPDHFARGEGSGWCQVKWNGCRFVGRGGSRLRDSRPGLRQGCGGLDFRNGSGLRLRSVGAGMVEQTTKEKTGSKQLAPF